MLNRSIIILSCVCMLGMTVLPASAIPCCCKSVRIAVKHTCPHPAGMGAGSCSPKHNKVKACCEKQAQASGCSGKFIKSACPTCRCLEQVQIVALTGYAIGDSPVRLASAVVTPDSLDHVSQPGTDTTPLPATHPDGHLINLRTCTLRC